MKIRSLGAVLFHAEGQTGLTKPIVTFGNFANAPKKRGISENRLTVKLTASQITLALPKLHGFRSQKTIIQATVGFTVKRVVLEHFFLPSTSILSRKVPLMLHTHISFIYRR
jgi:hypothetical protein